MTHATPFLLLFSVSCPRVKRCHLLTHSGVGLLLLEHLGHQRHQFLQPHQLLLHLQLLLANRREDKRSFYDGLNGAGGGEGGGGKARNATVISRTCARVSVNQQRREGNSPIYLPV